MIHWLKKDGHEKMPSKTKSNWLDIMPLHGDLIVPQFPPLNRHNEDDEELQALHLLHPISPALQSLQDIDCLPEGTTEEYSSK